MEDLDPGVAPIIRALNRRGLPTYMSCEGGSGHEFPFAWIGFGRELTPRERLRASSIIRGYTETPFEWDNEALVLFKGPVVGPDDFSISRDYLESMIESYGPPEEEPMVRWLKTHYRVED